MIEFDPGSFRDPAGRVFYHDGAVCRTLSETAQSHFHACERAGLWTQLADEQLIVPGELVPFSDIGLDPAIVGHTLLRQPRIPVVSYSYEWSDAMLRVAALTTLRIQECALRAGFTLKDAPSFNILFDGLRPKLVDLPSLEPYRDGQVWNGYAQFCRGFLFPLLLAAHRRVNIRPLLRGWAGEIPAAETAKSFSWSDALKPGVLTDILLQSRLERLFGTSQEGVRQATQGTQLPKAALLGSVGRLAKTIEKLPVANASSEWSDYAHTHSYGDADVEVKTTFVRSTFTGRNLHSLVDLGCNTGRYTKVALAACARVTAVDIDSDCIDGLFRAVDRSTPLTLLVADLTNPSPGQGWALAERRPLLPRIQSDGFLALGLIHHLRVTSGIPLSEIVAFLFSVAPEGVVEWIDKSDGMVQRMLSLRADVFGDYTWEEFQRQVLRHGQILATAETHGGLRRLCHVRRSSES